MEFDVNQKIKERSVYADEVFKLLPNSSDIELVVLKGHLAIEEFMYLALQDHVQDFKWIKEARLSFNQLVCILRSMNKMEGLNDAYSAILALNSIRNKCAHSLRGEGINAPIAKLRHTLPYISEKHENSDIQFIKSAVGHIISMISILCPINSRLEEIKAKDIVIQLPKKKSEQPDA